MEFKPGKAVWIVEHDSANDPVGVVKHMFLAESHGFAICSAFLYGVTDVVQTLQDHVENTQDEGSSYLGVYPMCDCFATKAEAKAALHKIK